MEKHTPGPWKVDTGTLDDDTNPRHVMASDGDYTCTAYGDTPQEADANAALIAASPDLLKACKAAQSALDGLANEWDANPQRRQALADFAANTAMNIRAAIAKATD